MAGKGTKLLTLGDVRDYLIDTNAVKEAEKLLLSSSVVHDDDDDDAARLKRDEQRLLKSDNATDTIRNRYNTGGKQNKRDELVDGMVHDQKHGKLGLLREEEELKELQHLEQMLREESMTLERERMKVAAQAQTAKRSQILSMEREAEQDLLQLEIQRTQALKDLDKKQAAMEALQDELRNAELDLDNVAERKEKGNSKEVESVDENSSEQRQKKMFELFNLHTVALTKTQSERQAAEADLKRLNRGQYNTPADVLGTSGDGGADTETKPVDAARIEALTSDVAMQAAADRVEKLKLRSKADDDDLNLSDSLSLAMDQARKDSVNRARNPNYEPREDPEALRMLLGPGKEDLTGLHDTLDDWIGGTNKADDEGEDSAPGAGAGSGSGMQIEVSQQNENDYPSLRAQMGLPNSTKASTRSGSFTGAVRSRKESRAEISEMPDGRMNEIDVLKAELAKQKADMEGQQRQQELKFQQQQQQQQQQYQQQQHQHQQHFQQPGMGGYGAPSPMANPAHPYMFPPPQQQQATYMPYQGMMGGMGMQQQPAQDPMQMMFLQQMQKMSEAMEKENQALLSQLNGGAGAPAPGGAQNPHGAGGYGAPGGPDNLVRGSGMQQMRSQMRVNARRREVEEAEMKYHDDIRRLDLEMERTRRQVELDDFNYEIEKKIEIRRQEDEHQAWLDEQKHEMQSMKMKQAMAKEQRILDMQIKQLQPSASQQAGVGGAGSNNQQQPSKAPEKEKADLIKDEAGVGTVPLPADLAKGVSVLADGFTIPESYTTELKEAGGGSFRMVVGIYDGTGELVTNMAASKWQKWEGAVDDPKQEPKPDADDESIASVATLLEKEDIHVLNMLPVTCKRLIKAGEKPIKNNWITLIEIQTKPNGAEQSSLGWSVINCVSVDKADSEDDASPDVRHIRNGMWRLNIRLGMSDPHADPLKLPESEDTDGYIPDGFIFIRLGDSGEATRQYDWLPESSHLSTELEMLNTYTNPLQKELPLEHRRKEAGGGVVNSGHDANADGQMGAEGRDPDLILPSSLLAGPDGSMSSLSDHKKNAMMKLKAMGMLGKHTGSNSTLSTIKDLDIDGDATIGMGAAKKRPKGEKPKVPWLKGAEPGQATEKFQKGDGVDIYIDGGMFLPNNTTITRVVAKFFNYEKEPVDGPYECFSTMSQSAINPNYKFKIELRGTSLNVTQTCLLRIDTLDSATCTSQTIGYACFKVFCSKDRVQPKTSNEPNVYINSGLRQIRVYGQRVQPNEFFDETMLDAMPKIPCASILIRIRGAPRSEDGMTVLCQEDVPPADWEKLGLDVQAPAYTSGEYYGGDCEPDDTETYAYPAKAPFVSTTVDGAISLALSAIKGKPSAPEFEARPVSGSEEETRAWAKKLLDSPTDMKTVLDYSLIGPYSLDTGICVSIDMLFNMPEVSNGYFSTTPGNVFKVIYSIVPPGLYYKDPPMSEEVYFTKTEDYSRAHQCPTFQDGFTHFFPPLLDDQSFLVIEVRSVTIAPSTDKAKPKDKKNTEPDIVVEPATSMEKSYWTLLPVSKESFEGDGFKYTLSGTFQLPLMKGSIPSSDIFNAETTDPLGEIYNRLGPKGKSASTNTSLQLADGASIILRVCNPMFKKMLEFAERKPEDPSTGPAVTGGMDKNFMSTILQTAATGVTGASIANNGKFQYDANKFNVTRGDKSTMQRLPGGGQGMDMKIISKSINKLFSKESGIPLEG